MSILEESFNGTVYFGKRTLRHDEEPSVRDLGGNDELESEYPEARPHIFVKFDEGVSLKDALASASNIINGSSGIVVQYQKEVRDNSTPAEVQAWRDKFTPDRLEGIVHEVENLSDQKLESVVDDIASGAPFVILTTSEITLDVPKQVADMRDFLVEWIDGAGMNPFEEHPENMSDAQVRNLYEMAQNM